MRLGQKMPAVSTDTPAASTEKLEQKLRQSIDVLCEDAARVEIWATALSAFTHPVPGYKWSEQFRLDASTNARRRADFGASSCRPIGP